MDRTATGAVALQTERRCSRSTRETAEREQKGSAARSAQQMSARRAAPCPKAMTPARYAKKQDARILQRKDRRRKTSRHRAPNFSFGRKQLRVEFCSIVTARAPAFALPVWNGTGTRFAPNRPSSPPQRMRNDSRSQARNRPQSRRPRIACLLSSRTSIAHARRISNVFFRRIDNRRNCTRSNSSRRYVPRLQDWFNWFLARLIKLRLLDSRRE